MTRSLVFARVAAVAVVATTAACAGLQRPRNFTDQDWVAAAREFDRDSSQHRDEKSLYRAGFLFGTPGRPMYDPIKAQGLLTEFVDRFPDSNHREEVKDRLVLLEDVVQTQRSAIARQKEIESRLETATSEARVLRERLDSASVQGEQARKAAAKLESDLKDREEQVRALRLELQRLKEIDLKPRRPR